MKEWYAGGCRRVELATAAGIRRALGWEGSGAGRAEVLAVGSFLRGGI